MVMFLTVSVYVALPSPSALRLPVAAVTFVLVGQTVVVTLRVVVSARTLAVGLAKIAVLVNVNRMLLVRGQAGYASCDFHAVFRGHEQHTAACLVALGLSQNAMGMRRLLFVVSRIG